MKISILLFLVIAGCMAAGCVGQIKTTAANVSVVTPSNTFIPVSNVTPSSTLSKISPSSTISNVTNTTVQPGLKGQLKISLYGWIGEFPVSIDRVSRGIVSTQRPITLMLEEGNHTVEVCCGVVCERQNVTIKFGEQRFIDFSEQLQKNCEFIEPTVRIEGYYMNGDQITVNVEFINPTKQTHTMSAEISCGYSYIESRSNNRVRNFAQSQIFSTVNAGDRIIKTVNLNLASGSSYNYDIPTITSVSSK